MTICSNSAPTRFSCFKSPPAPIAWALSSRPSNCSSTARSPYWPLSRNTAATTIRPTVAASRRPWQSSNVIAIGAFCLSGDYDDAIIIMVRPADAMPEPRLGRPFSRPQRRFWVLDQLDPGNPALNIAVRWRLEGDVPVGSVEHTFRLIIARHETLRTYFEQINGDPVQIVESRVSFNVP